MNQDLACLDSADDYCILRLRVQPGAKRTSVIGLLGDQLKIAVQAPPVDGRANEALLKWLCSQCGAKNAQVTLISGQASRDKRVMIRGVQAARIRAALGFD